MDALRRTSRRLLGGGNRGGGGGGGGGRGGGGVCRSAFAATLTFLRRVSVSGHSGGLCRGLAYSRNITRRPTPRTLRVVTTACDMSYLHLALLPCSIQACPCVWLSCDEVHGLASWLQLLPAAHGRADWFSHDSSQMPQLQCNLLHAIFCLWLLIFQFATMSDTSWWHQPPPTHTILPVCTAALTVQHSSPPFSAYLTVALLQSRAHMVISARTVGIQATTKMLLQ